MEAKALSCNIVPGRLPQGAEFTEWLNKYSAQAGPPKLHPEQPALGEMKGESAGGHAQEGKSG